jgi:ABC-2 type transport system ATP-binding protein
MEEADQLCDRVALMSRGEIRVSGTPEELKASVGSGASLEDVFRHYAGEHFEQEGGSLKDVRAVRRTASRLG